MLETTIQQQCKIKYIYVEMIFNKENKYDVVAGLFKGIVKKKDEVFILLHGVKNATIILNTNFYNIMSVEILEKDYKNMTYLTSEDNDQKMAFQLLGESNEMLLKHNFGLKNDTKIIDIEKYKDVPSNYMDGKSINKDITKSDESGTKTSTFSSSGNDYKPKSSSNATIYRRHQTKDEKTPAIISRAESKKPTKSDLELMRERIEQIKKGTYEHVLPETLGEEPGDDDDDLDNRFDRNCYSGYGYG